MNDVVVQDEWATPLLFSQIEGSTFLNISLREEILAREAVFNGKVHTSDPHQRWNAFSQLHYEQDLLSWNTTAISSFRNTLINLVPRFLERCPTAFRSQDYFIMAWANVHRLGDWHGCHTHWDDRGQIASGVYWVEVPPPREPLTQLSGQLILFDPRGHNCPWRYRKIIEPTAGQLIMHPAWLAHEVAPLRSTEPRISIAFDILGKTPMIAV